MVLRKPNLLDAFQASAPEGKKALPGQRAASAAGPFAQPRAPHADALLVPLDRRSLWRQMASDRLVQFAIVVCIVGVGIAYYVGRTNSQPSSALAAGESPGAGTILRESPGTVAQSPDPVEANRKAAALSTSPADRAFFEMTNRVTVRVAQYSNDEAGKKAALADRDYLRAEGYPVVQPVNLGRVLVLCVGAKPSTEELAKMLELVSKLPGPKGGRKAPFQGAYLENINKLVARK